MKGKGVIEMEHHPREVKSLAHKPTRAFSSRRIMLPTPVTTLSVILLRCLGLAVRWFLALSVATICIYQVVASPPLHLFGYEIQDPAGMNSVYVPGSGFSGVWFHLGFLQALPSIHSHDFYCYSSGCLSVVMAILNTTLETATENAHAIQSSWMAGNLSRYDLVDRFIDNILYDNDDAIDPSLVYDRLHVLVTTNKQGVVIEKARNATQLKELLLKTTYIPFITGKGFGYAAAASGAHEGSSSNGSGELHLDGGFSRALHPKCDIELHVPISLWDISQHTLNPSLNRDKVQDFWLTGQEYRYKMLSSTGSVASK